MVAKITGLIDERDSVAAQEAMDRLADEILDLEPGGADEPYRVAAAGAHSQDHPADGGPRKGPDVCGGPGAGPGAGGPPDFTRAAEALGVTMDELLTALGPPPPDLEAAAATLGVTVEELQAALPPPPRPGP